MPAVPPAAAVSAGITEIARALSRIAYLSSRVRNHDRLMALAGVPLDRAAVALLSQIADSEPLRPSELAVRLGVEASHVTRQAQQLQKAGYVTRISDPDDHRAQRIQLTTGGQEAVDRIREASYRGMQMALAHWSPQELQQLATLFQRMVGDLIARADAEAGAEAQALPGGIGAPGSSPAPRASRASRRTPIAAGRRRGRDCGRCPGVTGAPDLSGTGRTCARTVAHGS